LPWVPRVVPHKREERRIRLREIPVDVKWN
jgi:hypothetical protein